MDPTQIELNTVDKMFEYEKISREIDTCDDIKLLKNIAKSHIKLYLAQQEIISNLGMM
jgi:hypothetical protein